MICLKPPPIFISGGGAPTSDQYSVVAGRSASNGGSLESLVTGTLTTVITLPISAPDGWIVLAQNLTHPANPITQSGSTDNSFTLTGITTAGDIISYIAIGT